MKKFKKFLVIGLSSVMLLGTASANAGSYCDAFGHNYQFSGWEIHEYGPNSTYCYRKQYFKETTCETCGKKNPHLEGDHEETLKHIFNHLSGKWQCSLCGYEP